MVLRPVARAYEKIYLIHFLWIVLGGVSGKDSEAPVQTLRAAAAMGVQFRDIVAPRAAHSVSD